MSLDKNTRKIHHVKVDRKACIGAVTCVIVAASAFEMDSENIAVVKKDALKNTDDSTLFIAAQSCPVQAIELYNEKNQKIFP